MYHNSVGGHYITFRSNNVIKTKQDFSELQKNKQGIICGISEPLIIATRRNNYHDNNANAFLPNSRKFLRKELCVDRDKHGSSDLSKHYDYKQL